MAAPEFPGQFYPSKEEAKNRWLRAFAGGMARRGLTANTLPNSEADVKADATASQVVVAFANNKLSQRGLSPLTAEGDNLLSLAAAHGIEPREAGKAAGFVKVRVAGSGTVTIPAGFRCTATDGKKYETTALNTGVANLDPIEVIAIEGGASTNKSPGAILQWDNASIAALKREAEVDAGGLAGGRDADSLEIVRSRLLDRLKGPGVGYNWAQVKEWAEEASSAVSRAYVYPAMLGPSSYSVALTKSDGDRVVEDAIVQQVAAYIASKVPGWNRLNCTTVTAVNAECVIKANLPLPVHAGGAGGGWLDSRPWPNATTGAVEVDTYDSATGILTTDYSGASSGIAIGTRIAIWSSVAGNERFYEYEVSEVTSTSPVAFKVQGGFQLDHTGQDISAAAENIKSYGEIALAWFQKLGPGEKTSSNYLLPRSLRKPALSSSDPSAVTSALFKDLQNAHSEFIGLEFQSASTSAPSVPSATSDPPRIYVLSSLAFIASTT